MKAYLFRRGASRARFGVNSVLAGLLVGAGAAAGGIGRAQPPSRESKPEFSHLAPERSSSEPPHPGTPPALLNGNPVTWEDLRPSLTEAAGAQALQEAVLDRLLADQMKAKGLSVSAGDIAAERTLLTDSITRDSKTSPADAERLLEQVRRSRGLGEYRFERLLERNARMRKLVSGTVTVSDDEVNQAFQISHGPKYRARVILLPTEREAAAARGELVPSEPPAPEGEHPTSDISPQASRRGDPHPTSLSLRFGELALKRSNDPSAGAGGLLDPISPADPAYPASVRQALQSLSPGEVSPVLAVDRGFAILLLEEKLPADGASLAELTAQIRAEIQKRKERLAMDDLARSLLRSARLSIMDPELDWSWKAAGPRGQR